MGIVIHFVQLQDKRGPESDTDGMEQQLLRCTYQRAQPRYKFKPLWQTYVSTAIQILFRQASEKCRNYISRAQPLFTVGSS